MEIINTGLSSYLLIDKIESVTNNSITSTVELINVDAWMLLESFAQTATYHQRYLSGFERHHFLLKVKWFNGLDNRCQGFYRINALLKSQTELSAIYEVATADGTHDFQAELIITTSGLIEVEDQNFYRSNFQCLRNAVNQ